MASSERPSRARPAASNDVRPGAGIWRLTSWVSWIKLGPAYTQSRTSPRERGRRGHPIRSILNKRKASRYNHHHHHHRHRHHQHHHPNRPFVLLPVRASILVRCAEGIPFPDLPPSPRVVPACRPRATRPTPYESVTRARPSSPFRLLLHLLIIRHNQAMRNTQNMGRPPRKTRPVVAVILWMLGNLLSFKSMTPRLKKTVHPIIIMHILPSGRHCRPGRAHQSTRA